PRAGGGAADRPVVIADQQAAGRGRRGRIWQAPPRTSLLASILVRSRLPQALLASLSPTTAVSTAEALRRVAPLSPRLKWPNDVLVGGRKIAGLLLESRWVASAGPGRAPGAPGTGRPGGRAAVVKGVLEEFDTWRARLEGEGFGPVRERWKSLSDTIGRHVTVDGVSGTATDLDADGALLIDAGDGVRRIIAGEISTDEMTGEAHAARR